MRIDGGGAESLNCNFIPCVTQGNEGERSVKDSFELRGRVSPRFFCVMPVVERFF